MSSRVLAHAALVGLVICLAASSLQAGEPSHPSSSLPRADSLLVVVTLEKDVHLVVARVEPHGKDYIRLVRLDGTVTFVPVRSVVSILDWSGRERIGDVLVDGRVVGDPRVAEGRRRIAGFKFMGVPLPETHWFLVTHVGVAARLDEGSSLYEKSGAYVLADLGAMRNIGEEWAVGANLYVGADDYRSRVGPKARLRYWMNRTTSIDAAAGILLDGADDWMGSGIFPGYVGELNMGFREEFLLTAAVETVDIEKYGAKERDTSWYLGAKTGGVNGVIVALAGLAVLGIMEVALGALD